MKIGNNEISVYQYESEQFLDIVINGKIIRLNHNDMTEFTSSDMTNQCSFITEEHYKWLIDRYYLDAK